MTDPATDPAARFQAVIAEIDGMNAGDPRRLMNGGKSRPREVVYAEQMSECLAQHYPAASEVLRIAARAQHICRWKISRADYPLGRDGYNLWRAACREHHAGLVSAIMRRHCYADGEIAQVAKIIRKEELKRDHESQALENVAAVVFARHYLEEFVATHQGYDEDKLVGILRKTMRKMDAVGHAAVRAVTLPPGLQRAMEIAMKP